MKYVSLIQLTNILNQLLDDNLGRIPVYSAHELTYPRVQNPGPPLMVTDDGDIVRIEILSDAETTYYGDVESRRLGGIELTRGFGFEFPHIMELRLFDDAYPWLDENEKEVLKITAYVAAMATYRAIYFTLNRANLEEDAEFWTNLFPDMSDDLAQTLQDPNPMDVLTQLHLIKEWEDISYDGIKLFLANTYEYSCDRCLKVRTWTDITRYNLWFACGYSLYDILKHMGDDDANRAYALSRYSIAWPLMLSYFIMEQQTPKFDTMTQTEYHNYATLCNEIMASESPDYFTEFDDDDYYHMGCRNVTCGWVQPHRDWRWDYNNDPNSQFAIMLIKQILIKMRDKAASNISNVSVRFLKSKSVKGGSIRVVLDEKELNWTE